MDAQDLSALRKELLRQREVLFKAVADTEADLRAIAESREAELEERAQDERMARLYARLDDRGRRELEEFDAALRRIAAGSYGLCAGCGESIPLARLEALPATLLCIDCAREREAAPPEEAEGTEAPKAARLPQDLHLLSDRELEAVLRDQLREEERIDAEELRIVCRHGVVYLAGTLPSESEHQILRQLLTDRNGLEEIVDRIEIKELPWEREDRAKAETRRERPAWYEPSSTEDVVEAAEEGVDYEPPARPTPEEE